MSTMRAAGTPAALAVARVIAEGSGKASPSASRYHWAKSANGLIGASASRSARGGAVDMMEGSRRRAQKKMSHCRVRRRRPVTEAINQWDNVIIALQSAEGKRILHRFIKIMR